MLTLVDHPDVGSLAARFPESDAVRSADATVERHEFVAPNGAPRIVSGGDWTLGGTVLGRYLGSSVDSQPV